MFTMRFLKLIEGRGAVFLGIVAAVAVLVPFCNLARHPPRPSMSRTARSCCSASIFCYAMFAIALDLVWAIAASSA